MGETAADAGDAATTSASASDGTLLEDVSSSSSLFYDFDPVGLAASAIEVVHTTTGLPWWATIAAGAVVVRTTVGRYKV
jgi:hypothetical protein